MRKNILICLGVFAFVFAFSRLVDAIDPKTYSTYELSAASGTVFTGHGYVKAIQSSSGTANYTPCSVWWQLIDSSPINANSYSNFASATKKTLPYVFFTTPTYTDPTNRIYEFPDPGIWISSGCFVFKTSANSGEALKLMIYFRR